MAEEEEREKKEEGKGEDGAELYVDDHRTALSDRL